MLASLPLQVAAWLATYAVHSTVLLGAALLAHALLARAARRSRRVAGALPAWRERIGRVALLGGLATASAQLALGIELSGPRPALLEREAAVTLLSQEPGAARPDGPARSAAEPGHGAAPGAPQRGAAPPLLAPPFLVAPALEFVRRAADAVDATAAGVAPAADAPAPVALAATPEPSTPTWVLVALGLWAAGVALGALRWLRAARRLERVLRGSRPVRPGALRALFDGLCARAGVRDVGLRVADGLSAPITCGAVRPEVCLPPRALTELSRDELAALLAHEIAHAERRDPAWIAVWRALEVVLFVQPLNRVLARRLEDDAEHLCDDRAIALTGERLPLASCLTEVASWVVGVGRAPRLAAGMAASGRRLSRRVERLVVEDGVPAGRRAWPAPTFAALAFAAGVALLVPGFAAERVRAEPGQGDAALDLQLALAPVDEPDAFELDAALDAVAESGTAPAPATALAPEPAPPLAGTLEPALPAAVPELAGAFRELERELDGLQAELDRRVGGDALRARVEAMHARLRLLRLREMQLEAALSDLSTPTTPTPEVTR